MKYIIPSNPTEFKDAVSLFNEYANSLNISLDFQNFDEELNIIHAMYGSPQGCLLLVYDEGKAIGCAAYRKFEEGICELKRMYIKPAYRGKNIGQALLDMLSTKAFLNGYCLMRLDSLDTMLPALSLYRKNDFYEIAAYYFNPNAGVFYMEKKL